MATLSKNGTEIARFDLLKKSYSVRSNGKILKNIGYGWNQCRLKSGVTASDFMRKRRDMEDRLKLERPALLQYRAAVLAEFPLAKRHRFFAIIGMISDDVEVIWSELRHAQISVNIETLKHIMKLRKLSAAEKLDAESN